MERMENKGIAFLGWAVSDIMRSQNFMLFFVGL